MKLKSTLIVLSLVAAPAFASDQAVSKTREQVRAELAQAQRSGDMLAFGESGLTLKQINPGAYPVATSTQVGKSREQVRDELEQARLASVTLPAVSPHAGKPLDDLALHAVGVAVVSLRRADGKGLRVDGAQLAGGDTLVISGTPAALARAEEKLLVG